MTTRRRFSSPFIAALVPCTIWVAIGSFASVSYARTGDRAASGNTGLAAVLDSVKTENLRADLEFIASDDMEGRDTPSRGLRTVARFIRARLMRLGLQPGASGDFFQRYPLQSNKMDLAGTFAALEKGSQRMPLSFGKDYFFRGSSTGASSTSGTLMYAGTGRKEDFGERDFSGKWAVVMNDMRMFRDRERNARPAKALGVLVVPNTSVPFDQHDAFFQGFAEMSSFGSVRWPSNGDHQDPERVSLPSCFLSSAVFVQMLKMAGIDDPAQWKPEPGQTLDVTFVDERKPEAGGGMIEVENVCGFWPGSDPVLSKEVILVSAHYDHVGIQRGQVYNGADDNGSGTTGLLALAEALATHGPMRRSVMLIWVSGEEKGLWGSRAWAEKPSLPEGYRPFVDINIDMIGRNEPDKLLITPTSAHPSFNGLSRIACALSAEEGFPTLGSADAYWERSDQLNFAKLGIPVIFLFSDVHKDYHQSTDDADKIDYDKMRRVVRLVVRVLDQLQQDHVAVGKPETP